MDCSQDMFHRLVESLLLRRRFVHYHPLRPDYLCLLHGQIHPLLDNLYFGETLIVEGGIEAFQRDGGRQEDTHSTLPPSMENDQKLQRRGDRKDRSQRKQHVRTQIQPVSQSINLWIRSERSCVVNDSMNGSSDLSVLHCLPHCDWLPCRGMVWFLLRPPTVPSKQQRSSTSHWTYLLINPT